MTDQEGSGSFRPGEERPKAIKFGSKVISSSVAMRVKGKGRGSG